MRSTSVIRLQRLVLRAPVRRTWPALSSSRRRSRTWVELALARLAIADPLSPLVIRAASPRACPRAAPRPASWRWLTWLRLGSAPCARSLKALQRPRQSPRRDQCRPQRFRVLWHLGSRSQPAAPPARCFSGFPHDGHPRARSPSGVVATQGSPSGLERRHLTSQLSDPGFYQFANLVNEWHTGDRILAVARATSSWGS